MQGPIINVMIYECVHPFYYTSVKKAYSKIA